MGAPVEAQPLTRDDLRGLDGDDDLVDLLRQALDRQSEEPFAVTVSVPYKTTLWANGKLDVVLHGGDVGLRGRTGSADRIVGIVKSGVFEIYEEEMVQSSVRRNTTLLLQPGMSFGLFERYGPWHGGWKIISGVISFVVTNPCGNADKWRRKGRFHLPVTEFQLEHTSRCAFEPLIPTADSSSWAAECILFWPDRISDVTLRLRIENALLQTTVQQLLSAYMQEATRRVAGQEGPKDMAKRFLEFVDSVANPRTPTPIFQLLGRTDEKWLPAGALFAQLDDYSDESGKERGKEKEKEREDWHVLVPRPIERGATGLYLGNYVPRFPAGCAESLVSLDQGVLDALAMERQTPLEEELINGVRWIRYKEKYLLRGFKGTTENHPIHFLTNNHIGGCACKWSSRFKETAVIRDLQ